MRPGRCYPLLWWVVLGSVQCTLAVGLISSLGFLYRAGARVGGQTVGLFVMSESAEPVRVDPGPASLPSPFRPPSS